VAKFNLVTIRPAGFLHSSAFSEVKDSLAWSLTELGHEVVLTENSFSAQATNIIFGAELIPPGATLPDHSIIFNLEHPSHPNLGNVRTLAKGHTIWDHSKASVADWKQRGFQARHLPIGYTPNLTRIPRATTQDIDVSFLGWMTPRRKKIMEALKEAGLDIFYSDCCYGGARDYIISKSKVCLNVHHDGRDRFEIVRVSYLMANSKAVISEISVDDTDYDFQGAIIRCPYAELVDKCKNWISENSVRPTLEFTALGAIQQRDFTLAVSHVLTHEGPHPLISTVHGLLQARYERGLKEGDMVDFLPWLREHAKGKILEIGTRDGASTSAFLLGLEFNGGHLTSIDITDCSHLWTHPQWNFQHGNSLQAQFPDSTFDLVLIDGDHSQAAYRGDLYNAYYWTRPGGLIVTHDLVPERGHEFYAVGIREEFDKFLRLHPELKHSILPGKYGLGIMEKPR